MATVIDGRELQPPEPLELALTVLDTLPDSEELVMLLYCQPHPLYQALRRNGYVWEEIALPDGCFEIHIRKAV
jgi:hypothetical protein